MQRGARQGFSLGPRATRSLLGGIQVRMFIQLSALATMHLHEESLPPPEEQEHGVGAALHHAEQKLARAVTRTSREFRSATAKVNNTLHGGGSQKKEKGVGGASECASSSVFEKHRMSAFTRAQYRARQATSSFKISGGT